MMKRSRSRRRRQDNPPVGQTTLRGLAAFALVVAFIGTGVIAFNGVPFREYRHINISAPDVGNLLLHDPVRIAGVRVGQVESTSLGPDGRPLVRLQIEPATKLPSDTKVLLRGNGLLGARYIELIPGQSAQPLADGATIVGGRGTLTFGVSHALDTFDAPTRKGLGTTLNEVGTGLVGRGAQLNDALRLAPHGVGDSLKLTTTIARDRAATRQLLPSLDSALRPLAANRSELTALIGETADVLQPFVDEQDKLRGILEQAPPALTATEQGLASGERLLTAVTGLASEAARILPLAPRGLRATTALLHDSPAPLHRANTLLAGVPPTVPSVLHITRRLPPLLKPLRNGLGDLTPVLLKISPYGCDIKNWGAVMRSMDGFGGFGNGPIGPLGEFRAQASVVSVGGTAGIDDGTGLAPRDTYPPPCKYLATPYPTTRP
jgi:phospholipid/cholesterol/gamma-HCH transport system substrate-binding protein